MNKMPTTKSIYDANFTAGSLLFNEFTAIEPIIKGEKINKDLQNEIEVNNYIGIKTRSARKRIILEVSRRINSAPKKFWHFFYELESKEQKLALFYLCLKTYTLIFDLHFEVAVKKFKTTGTMTDYDIQMRLDEIASNDSYVEKWSESTFKKINVAYRKSIKDADLFDGKNLTKTSVQNHYFWNYFSNIGDNWFTQACFLNF